MENYFKLRQRGTDFKTEVIAGITTFLTMGYIIFVNPAVLSPTGMDETALIAVTCLVSAAATIAVGLIANAPIAMAPGMGLNAFFAYLVGSGKMNWQSALGAVFISGLVFLILSIFGLRKKIVKAIPESLISAIAVGIGLFITFIGLVKLGVVVSDEHTLVSAGALTPEVLTGLFGLLVMLYFDIKKVSGGLVLGILAATALAWILGKVQAPEALFAINIDITPTAFKLNIPAALKWGFFGSIFTLMFMDMFDSIGTLVACCQQAGMMDENKNIRGIDRLLGIDAAATMFGALLGTSTTTAYLESAAGIEQGARTGLTSVVTGIMFLTAMLFMPVIGIVPDYATAPALIMVGLFMIKEVTKINFARTDQAFPGFIIIVMIALSYSISTGLAFGFISYTLIKVISGKLREITLTMWIITILSFLFLLLEQAPGILEKIR
jgi:AGZA family xanthine/uracil permease-like MFS transporter